MNSSTQPKSVPSTSITTPSDHAPDATLKKQGSTNSDQVFDILTHVNSFSAEGKIIAPYTYDQCPDPVKLTVHTQAADQVTFYYESTGSNQMRHVITVLNASQAKKVGDDQTFEYEWKPPTHYGYFVWAEAKGPSGNSESIMYRVYFKQNK